MNSLEIKKNPRMDTNLIRRTAQRAFTCAANVGEALNAKENEEKLFLNLNAHYREGAKSPSMARLIYKDTFNKFKYELRQKIKSGQESIRNYSKKIASAQMNCLLAEASVDLEESMGKYADAWRTLYDRTGEIRRYLIDKSKILMDEVTTKSDFLTKAKVRLLLFKSGRRKIF